MSEEVEVDEERVEVTDIPGAAIVRGKWVVVMVSFVKGGFESTKKGGHGEVHIAVAVIDGRVDEDRAALFVAEEVAGPKISVKEGGCFGGEDGGEVVVEALELHQSLFVQQMGIGGQAELGFEAPMDEEADPVGRGGVVLGKGAHVVVGGESGLVVGGESGLLVCGGMSSDEVVGGEPELRLRDAVEGGELFTKKLPEFRGAETFVDPFEDQQLVVIGFDVGDGFGHAKDVLPAQ